MSDLPQRTKVMLELHRRKQTEHASIALHFISNGNYSGAATECHRAHQEKLIADQLLALLRLAE